MSNSVLQEEPRNRRNETVPDAGTQTPASEVGWRIDVLQERFRQYSAQVHANLVEASLATVAEVTEQLSAEIAEPSKSISYDNLRRFDIASADIERDCDQLKLQVTENRFDGKLPCSLLGEDGFLVPVSYSELLMVEMRGTEPEGRAFLPIEQALRGFAAGLTQFLLLRIAARFFFSNVSPPPPNSSPPQMPIRVFSQTHGARVSYSPAYFISYVTFSAPTSPALGTILPGRYLFKITTNQRDFFDQALFDIPPSFDVSLMV